jgi:hypothetical protein
VDALNARLAKLEETLTAVAGKVDGLTSLDGKFNALSTAVAELRKDVQKVKAAGGSAPDGETPPK